MTFEALERLLVERLALPLPGVDAQLLLAPRPRYGWEPGLLPQGLRRAGVLLLLYPSAAGPVLVLTVRHAGLPQHAGQVCFPGGAAAEGESLVAAALRETSEEIGVDPARVRIVGSLSPLHVPVSGFALHPFVGLVAERPPLARDAREVERILEVEVSQLADSARRGVEQRTAGGLTYDVPYLLVHGEKVWGATAMVLAEFLSLLGRAPAAEEG